MKFETCFHIQSLVTLLVFTLATLPRLRVVRLVVAFFANSLVLVLTYCALEESTIVVVTHGTSWFPRTTTTSVRESFPFVDPVKDRL
jgi:hypothetical protein